MTSLCPYCFLFGCLITKFSKPLDPKTTLKVFSFQYYPEKIFLFFYNEIVYMFCATAVVCKQHLVWHHETCFQMATVHITAICVTLVKTYHSCIHELHFPLSENELNLHRVHGKHEGNKVFGNIQYIFCVIADTQ